MEVMSGIFCMDGGGHLVYVGVRGETVAELHAVMPSAPSCCDSKWHDDKRPHIEAIDEFGYSITLDEAMACLS